MGRTQDADRLVAFLESLRTVRFFEPNPVPQSALDDVLEVARHSGSARNRQPWEFVVVRDRQTLGRLAVLKGYAQHLSSAAAGIVLVMAGDPDKIEQETFDEGRLAERISLAAASHGLGSAVGWFAGGGREEAKRILGVPANGWSGPRFPWATPTATHRAVGRRYRGAGSPWPSCSTRNSMGDDFRAPCAKDDRSRARLDAPTSVDPAGGGLRRPVG